MFKQQCIKTHLRAVRSTVTAIRGTADEDEEGCLKEILVALFASASSDRSPTPPLSVFQYRVFFCRVCICGW
jgi:hypothetical protein